MSGSLNSLSEEMSPEAHKLSEDLDDELRDLSQLIEERRNTHETRIIIDPVSGLPVLDSGKDAPILTSEMVREMLKNFP